MNTTHLSTVHFSQITGETQLKLPLTPVSPRPCPFTHMDAVFFGWPLRDDEVPTKLVAYQAFDPSTMGDIHRMEFHLVFSDRLAQVIKRFDLGATRVVQVPIIDVNGQEIPGTWHHCHVAERKNTLVPLKTDGARVINRQRGLITVWPRANPGAIAVEPAAEHGVDLWRDPMWDFGMFASQRLVEALAAEGVGAEFQWMPARRATDEDRANAVLERQNDQTMPPKGWYD
jgi:hypothetical protein